MHFRCGGGVDSALDYVYGWSKCPRNDCEYMYSKNVSRGLYTRPYLLALITALRVRDETAGGRLRRAHAHNFLERDFGARLLLARVLGC